MLLRKLAKLIFLLSLIASSILLFYYTVIYFFFQYNDHDQSFIKNKINYYLYQEKEYNETDRISSLFNNKIYDKVIFYWINDNKYFTLSKDIKFPSYKVRNQKIYIKMASCEGLQEILHICNKLDLQIDKVLFIDFDIYNKYVIYIGNYQNESAAWQDIESLKEQFPVSIVTREECFVWQSYATIKQVLNDEA